MPAERFVNEDSRSSGTRTALLWALSGVVLVGVWLWLAFFSGGYSAGDWAFPALFLGVVGIVVASLAAYPRRPRQLSLAVLVPFIIFTLWVLASTLWASSSGAAWEAAGRTFLYLLAFTLALTFFTASSARTAFKYLFMTGSLVLLAVCIWPLWTVDDPAFLFPAGRFVYPVGQANAAAALFLIPFWPLMWLGAGPGEHAPVRGVALGLATGLIGLAIMTQSRGAAWSLGITVVILFVITPGRLRLLFYLVIPALLMVYAFPTLNQYWLQGAQDLSGGAVARTLTVAMVAAGSMGMIAALLEKWVKVSRRMKAIFGMVVLLGCVGGLVYGSLTLTRDIGGPLAWFEQTWQRLAGEPAAERDPYAGLVPEAVTGRAPTRAEVWEAAWQGMRGDLVLGTGADNPAAPSGALGPAWSSRAQADSLVLQVLCQTGIVGGVLAFTAMLLSVAGIMWPRTAVGWRGLSGARRRRHPGEIRAAEGPAGTAAQVAGHDVAPREDLGGERRTALPPATRWGRDPSAYGWEMALLAGVAYWFVHSNFEQLWQLTGVTFPALLMLAAALAAVDARARTMWPRFGRRLRLSRVSSDARLIPRGRLSEAFRMGLILLAAATVIVAVPAYLLESI